MSVDVDRIIQRAMDLSCGQDAMRDKVVARIYQEAESLANEVVLVEKPARDWDGWIDDVVTSRRLGYPSMLALLALVLWLTISGANLPSQLLSHFLFEIEGGLSSLFFVLRAPDWLHGLLVLGVYRCLAWVVSVMLPPMAIFFPLFTLLEDLGYLPRVAFNLDGFFKKAGAHGKQALTMSMGFGCNAAGVIACRIIESPRERLIAILTNNFVPCNGRFPTLITMSNIFLGTMAFAGGSAVLLVAGLVVGGIAVTLGVSWLLSRTLLTGIPSHFTLELPPYRPPQVVQVIVRSVFDRTLFVLWRAVKVAAPAGALVWLLANIHVNGLSLLNHAAQFLQPLGAAMGLDGFILLAFILGLPANEIVIPIILMSYLSVGAMLELDSFPALRQLLLDHGWTWVTALNMMLFSLLHFPCGTTLLTIHKETHSWKWTLLAALIPTIIGVAVCLLVAQGARLVGLV
ncbi:MAG: nucleoside recognition domain-containing protein [Limnochordia bacterium]|jgi:ferrous iron transport protein B